MKTKGLWASRILSLTVALYGLVQAHETNLLRSCFVYFFILISIWFPAKLNESMLGTFWRSNYINVGSPPVIVASLGWVILLVAVFSHIWIQEWYNSLN